MTFLLFAVLLVDVVDCRISKGPLQPEPEGERTAGLGVFYISQFARMFFS